MIEKGKKTLPRNRSTVIGCCCWLKNIKENGERHGKK